MVMIYLPRLSISLTEAMERSVVLILNIRQSDLADHIARTPPKPHHARRLGPRDPPRLYPTPCFECLGNVEAVLFPTGLDFYVLPSERVCDCHCVAL
ncbi:jg3996, partial [Pararge aegeria aegeria]